ncbi:hypothetical protein NDU88_004611 [Pleurodeles waltl]|uniref:Uncharacterized protein n=1 Tax=Pleurodeles waltl TaxID=8319 RepID=A0AAV7L1H2_PLEWA|nr:hypothetical protein NDU88_004611 [Pleurodeles waltl]
MTGGGGFHDSSTPSPSFSSTPGPRVVSSSSRADPPDLQSSPDPRAAPAPITYQEGAAGGTSSGGGGLPVLARPLHFRLAGQAGWVGGPGLPACTRRSVHRAGRSPGVFFLGHPATGIRRRGPVQAPPRDSLRSFSLPHTPSAQLSAWPRPSRACRGRHLVFPSRDRPDLRVGIKCRISVFFAVRDPRETQGHRGVRNGVFQLPWTALTMGG